MSKHLCLHYIKGKCKFGDECKKYHEDGLCKFFFINGHCKNGNNCKFSHVCPQGVKWKSPVKNTRSFNPTDYPVDLKIRINESINIGANDIVIDNTTFKDYVEMDLYSRLYQELKTFEQKEPELFKLWHGDTHNIANDRINWKLSCPTFNLIVNTMADTYKVDVKSTRLNFYENGSEWKPFHHDAAAINPDKAKTQNFTLGASFGATREVAFQYAGTQKNKTAPVVCFDLKDNEVYAFTKNINQFWKHGIRQNVTNNVSRISIIIWGWKDMEIDNWGNV